MAATKTTVDITAAMVTEAVPLADWLLVAPVLLTMAGGAISIIFRKKSATQPWIAITTIALVILSNIGLLNHVLTNGVVTMVMGSWLPPFGIAFTADPLGALLALTASVATMCVAVFAMNSIAENERRYGFYPFLLMLLCGVTGSFLTGDIFNLYVWFEVLLISSFGMQILGNEKVQIDGAVKYAVLNLIATTLFLAATGLLYGLVGTLNMADIAGKLKAFDSSGPMLGLATLYFLAFAMKAAAFPVNFWLPASYHTPRLVVAAIFAGLLTKVGVYALLRVMLLLMPEGRDWLASLIGIVAIATMLTGSLGALAQTDIRRLMAYLVIAGIGAMMAGIAVGNEVAVSGAIFYSMHSVLIMTALYLLVAFMFQMSGTFSLREIGGLYIRTPLGAGIGLILLLAVAGLPPFSGFWAKLLLVAGALEAGRGWVAAGILVSGLFTTIAVGRLWIFAFWRGGNEHTVDGIQALPIAGSSDASEISWSIWLPLVVLTALIFIIGILPETMMSITENGAKTLIDPTAYIGSVFGGIR
ncbi:Na(+)/H(+) antiporter subunit D [Pseudovibrio sp. W64]|uniref:Na+/H+ antiporter subunit D n=1 Tax=unclassified Pseudovibrio TaxID=2627060 RepID=UPI0007AEAADB|nr:MULTISPECIES: Na+/H+ antiporter subunit D [unclassified Pseudovibrio]KZK81652.1 Na(+)/H(+) antiporter subunit D [Pseudovibrio sp. W64]KZK83470.1 Na(+)/H(+) antiporter subunit D [Pseudovibrio sp. Ad13]KZK92161.1 Na(+)/H(+) antiporter subunit D [Pseudovibrio sp. Ad5]KZK94912.1 Na(+)/H(+) antiporter subunit D [Pseudovibrio sp. W74]KZL08716.1 Na(+)/H(+) antiporter subunit D [Pseudovibrio sp. Ad14]